MAVRVFSVNRPVRQFSGDFTRTATISISPARDYTRRMTDQKKTGTPRDSHYARLRRTHRDNAGSGARQPSARHPRPPAESALPADGLVRLYGLHTVRAALDNPSRKIRRMLVTRNALARLGLAEPLAFPFPGEIVEPREIDKIVGGDAVHQGVLLEAEPLRPKPLSALGDAR